MYNRSFFLRVPSKFLGVSLFLLFHIGFIQIDVYAQRVIPGDESIIVRHFAQADQLFLKQDSIAAMQEIKALDPLLDSLQTEYPLYSAVVKIWQAWYILVPTTVPVGYQSSGEIYLQEAAQLIGEKGSKMLDSLARPLQLIAWRFRNSGMIERLLPIDQQIRKHLPINRSARLDYSVSYYAWSLNNFYQSPVPGHMAAYEEAFLPAERPEKTDEQADHIGRSLNTFLWMSRDLYYWRNDLETINVSRLFTLYSEFTNEALDWVQADDRLNSSDNQSADSRALRQFQSTLYGFFLNDWAAIAIHQQETGSVANQLNEYLNAHLKKRIETDKEAQKPVRELYGLLGRTISNLTTIYNLTGQYQRSEAQLQVSMSQYYDWFNRADIADPMYQPLLENHFIQLTRSYIGQKNLFAARVNLSELRRWAYAPTASDMDRKRWRLIFLDRSLDLEEMLQGGKRGLRHAADSLTTYLDKVKRHTDQYPSDTVLPMQGVLYYHAARVHLATGNFAEAEKYLRYARQHLNPNDSQERPYFPSMLALHIQLQTKRLGYLADTTSLRILVAHTQQQMLRNLVSLAPDHRILFYEHLLLPYFDLYHSLLAGKYLNQFIDLRDAVMQQSLGLKNLMINNLGMLIGTETDPERIQSYQAINRINGRVLGIETESLMQANSTKYLHASTVRGNAEEFLYTSFDRSFRDSLFKLIRIDQIFKRLSPGDRYVEFVRYADRFRGDTISYLSIELNPETQAAVVRPLFTERDLLATAIQSIQFASDNGSGQRALRGLGIEESFESIRREDTLGHFLIRHLPPLLLAKRFIFVPDGLLNRISFSSLKYKGNYLFEKVQLKQLSASGQWLISAPIADSLHILFAGGIRYERENCTPDTLNRYLAKDFSWSYLPGSAEEVKRLSAIFRSNTKFRTRAVQSVTDSIDLKPYTYLHFATHGFYFNADEVDQTISDEYFLDYIREAPLTRCGLVIDQANCTGLDGYLMGYKLAAMDLNRCRLITLSACETALGEIKSNQGVLGIQRALKIAGVRKMLITLWKIPDLETVEFMELFYQRILVGDTEETALQKTQSVMCKKYPVRVWGAFVLIE
jgi:hypothetical protein